MDGAHVRHSSGAAPAVTGFGVEVERDYGALVAPIAALEPVPSLLAAAWTLVRATMVEPGLVGRPTKEAVATAVAHGNSCSYCEELHITVLEALNERRAAARAADNDIASLSDHRVRQITAWARNPAALRPFDDAHVPELVGTVVTEHLLDRVAIVLARDRHDDFAPVAERAHVPPPATRPLLPPASLPEDLSWAAGTPEIADAFARVAGAMRVAGHSVPRSVRGLLAAKLAQWYGEPREDTAGWLATALSALPEPDRLAGRLALLTAVAPANVDPALVSVFGQRVGERRLVELVSWAAFAAAARVGELVPPPAHSEAPPAVPQVLQFRPSRRPARRSPVRERRAGV